MMSESIFTVWVAQSVAEFGYELPINSIEVDELVGVGRVVHEVADECDPLTSIMGDVVRRFSLAYPLEDISYYDVN